MSNSIAVRRLIRTDMPTVLDWAANEGWNPGLHDADAFYDADPAGYLASLDGDDLAAVVSLVKFGADFAFLGLYICRPDLRGRGYGWRVWEAAMAEAGTRTIGLDGVPEQQANYARSGFRLAWQNARYLGAGGGKQPTGLVNLANVPFGRLVTFDAEVNGIERGAYLRAWLTQPGGTGLADLDSNGELLGWGWMRPCRRGWKIGPLLAEDADAAARVLDGLLAAATGDEVALDLPRENEDAVRLATERGMVPVFSTARMYRGTPPAVDLARLYGVASFELG